MENAINLDWDTDRIGICADIHAHTVNLRKMLDTRPDVEHWFCAGDAVDMFEEAITNETMVRALRSHNVRSVRGNHEQVVIDNQPDAFKDPGNRQYLVDLPISLTLQFLAKTVRICHGTPDDLEGMIPENASEDTFRRHFARPGTDVVVLAHIHKPFTRTVGWVQFVNPGPLCGGVVPPSYCILHADGGIEPQTLG